MEYDTFANTPDFHQISSADGLKFTLIEENSKVLKLETLQFGKKKN